MKVFKSSLFLAVLGLLFVSCSKKEEKSFNYSGMVGLWKLEKKTLELEKIDIPFDHCEEKTLLNIGTSTITKMVYDGLKCDQLIYSETGYDYYDNDQYINYVNLSDPQPGDTIIVNLFKPVTEDVLIIKQYSSDYATPNIVELLTYTKLSDYPKPIITEE